MPTLKRAARWAQKTRRPSTRSSGCCTGRWSSATGRSDRMIDLTPWLLASWRGARGEVFLFQTYCFIGGPYMPMRNRLGGHTNSYHTHSLEEALEGIAAAGYKYVELSAVRGWTEHVPLDADARTLGKIQRMLNKLNLIPISLSGHSDLTTQAGLQLGLQALDLCERMGIDILNTA